MYIILDSTCTSLHVFDKVSLAVMRSREEILETYIRYFKHAVNPGYLLLDDNALLYGAQLRVDYLEKIFTACNSQRLDFGASETGHTIIWPYYCGRDRYRCSQLSPYIYNGELSSKAVKRWHWDERVCQSKHLSDTYRFVKKPGKRTIGELCTNGLVKPKGGQKRKKREKKKELKKDEGWSFSDSGERRISEFWTGMLAKNPGRE
ncbi:hypothetical protein TNCV_1155751 [Trichonephila clavipes]|nr:hypothetical protein TNCV_1155751 [Trichonephila clavipes]